MKSGPINNQSLKEKYKETESSSEEITQSSNNQQV